jgi:uncharacterized protein involved in cysteine biosynthesis
MNAPRDLAGGAASGAALHLEGLRLLLRERSLWSLALVPFGLSAVALSLALAALVHWAAPLHAFSSGWLPRPEATAWYTWLWTGPLTALLWLVGKVLFLAVCGAALFAAWLLASVLAAPFLDALSRRVEAIVSGRVEDLGASGVANALRDGLRSVREELRRLLFFLAVQAAIAAFGILVPGGQAVAPLLMLGFTMLVLPLEYAGFALDRRRVPFAERRRWVLSHRAAMLGFGATAFATFFIPGLNFAALPLLVVSGTLLALKAPLPR